MPAQYGFAEQTPAVRSIITSAMGRVRGAVRRRARKAVKKAAASVKRRVRRKASKLVKGSAAAKAHMARLRKMRKR